GYSRTAAKYAGINEKRNIILSMAISGALAGLGAGLYYLTDTLQWNPQESTALPGIGFDGISVALLASSHPIGTIFSALLMAHISTGGSLFDASLFPPEVANIISGVIIYLCAFMMLFKNLLLKPFGIARRRREKKIANGKGGSRA
ncbi:MAG: ABC transporter permease, partial [Clostridia bacterium]|nr:ABC transporter permease [Clostridia bacterium]